MKKLYLFIVCCACITGLSAQYTRHIVQFTDKNGTPHTIANPSTYLSAKSIQRRTDQHIAIDSTDLPITPAYLAALAAVPNVQVYNSSKWLNQVLVRTNDPSALATINSFTFVRSTKQIATNATISKSNPKLNQHIFTPEKPVFYSTKNSQGKKTGTGNHDNAGSTAELSTKATLGILSLNYGYNYNQVHIHDGEFLHNKGYTGEGIEMAMMDAGYNSYLTNPVFDSIRNRGGILGTWDFVANEASVNEDHSHGALCFSTMAANAPGTIVGTAPHAKYWLFRTEDDASETPVEEQNWIAAAEYADSAGAKMFSTSLGYYAFDDPSLSYTHAQRDGNTAMITRAADLAARKGILLTVSAGNSGYETNDDRFVSVPADADSVLAIGAVDIYGNIAAFSSVGPNGAGKVKPNIVSVGQGTVFAWLDGSVMDGNGTSLSNPNIAGLIACLWQAFPENTNMQIIDAVQRSASRFSAPDNSYGNGIPNFRKAFNILMARSLQSSFAYNNGTMSVNWRMKADTSVSFVIEKKLPGGSLFLKVDSIHNNKAILVSDDHSLTDSIGSTTPGTFTYRLRIVIGTDTMFTGSEYSFNNPIPSEMTDSLSIQASLQNCVTTITWSMPDDASVTYRLEKLIPGTPGFAPVATINGSGTAGSFERKSYSYADEIGSASGGAFSYRLQVNIGTDTSFYSKVASVTSSFPCFTNRQYVFSPSPFRNELHLVTNTSTASNKMVVIIYDITGRKVYRHEGSKPAGYFHLLIPAGNFTSGVYLAKIFVDDKEVTTEKIVK